MIMQRRLAASLVIVGFLVALVSGLPWLSTLQNLLRASSSCNTVPECVEVISAKEQESEQEGQFSADESSVYTYLPLIKFRPKVEAVAVKITISFPTSSGDSVQICSDIEEEIVYLPRVHCGTGQSNFHAIETREDGNTTFEGTISLFHGHNGGLNAGKDGKSIAPLYVVYIENHNAVLPSLVRWSMEVSTATPWEIVCHLFSVSIRHLFENYRGGLENIVGNVPKAISFPRVNLGGLPEKMRLLVADPVRFLQLAAIPRCSFGGTFQDPTMGECYGYPPLPRLLQSLERWEAATPYPFSQIFASLKTIVAGTCTAIGLHHVFTLILLFSYTVVFFTNTYVPIVEAGDVLAHKHVWASACSHVNIFHFLVNWHTLVVLSRDMHWACSCNLMLLFIAYAMSVYGSALVCFCIWRLFEGKRNVFLVGASAPLYGMLALVVATSTKMDQVDYLLGLVLVDIGQLIIWNRLVDIFGLIGGYLGGYTSFLLFRYWQVLPQSWRWFF